MRNYREAQAAIEEAIAIRSALQENSDGKALFSKELNKAAEQQAEIVARRHSVQTRYQKTRQSITALSAMERLTGARSPRHLGNAVLTEQNAVRGRNSLSSAEPSSCDPNFSWRLSEGSGNGAGMGHLGRGAQAGIAPPDMPKPSGDYIRRKSLTQGLPKPPGGA